MSAQDAIAARLLADARAAGADAADVLIVSGRSLSIDVRAGKLEEAQRAESTEIGLRVLVGKRQAIASASGTSEAALSSLAERALAMARAAPEDPHAGIAASEALSARRDADGLELDDGAAEPDPAALEEAARIAEAAALAVPGVTQVQSAGAGWDRRQITLATSGGFAGSYSRSGHGLSCTAIAGTGTGMERDYDYDGRSHAADLRSPEEIGRRAGARAAERLSPRKPPTGTAKVLFDERVSGSLIGHLLAAINGSAIARGASWARGLLGRPVLPEGLTLLEEPLRARASGSRPFDAEGLAVTDRAWVDGGRLTGWTLDLATASRLGLASTGNATRGPGTLPMPGIGNLRLLGGEGGRDDLMREMGTGLLVTSMIGATINPNTGDYSRGAAGFWVENGAPQYPVSECTIAGLLPEMLLRMRAADDGRPEASRVIGSILVDGMMIAGA